MLATTLMAVSFWVAIDREVFWQPGVQIEMCVRVMAQMGISFMDRAARAF